jgi:hypothetical protein
MPEGSRRDRRRPGSPAGKDVNDKRVVKNREFML